MFRQLSISLFFSLTSILSLLTSTNALHNVTVDDKDPSITWVGNWTRTLPGYGKPYGGTYMTAKNDSSAYAEFKFTGIAVYFLSERWPYTVTTRLILDPGSPSSTPLLLSLEDYSTSTIQENFGKAVLLASATGLRNTEHTVRVDVGAGMTYAVFDAFVYTAVDAEDAASLPSGTSSTSPAFTTLPAALIASLPSTSSVSATSAPSPSSSSASSHMKLSSAQLIVILVSVFLAVFGVSSLALAWRFKCREAHEGAKGGAVDAEKRGDTFVIEDLKEKMDAALEESKEKTLQDSDSCDNVRGVTVTVTTSRTT